MILVVTHGEDVTADLAIRHLHAAGDAYVRLNTDVLGVPACHVGHDDSGPYLVRDDVRLRPGDVSAVWYRRFASPRVLENVGEGDREFVRRELSVVLDALLESIVGLEVNPPDVDRRTGNRLLQAMAARRVGLETPSTLVTQHSGPARKFLGRGHEVVTKALSFGRIDAAGDEIAYTSVVRPDDDLRGLAVCPSLFQDRVSSGREWRVTFVGDRAFSARTREGAPDVLDWRRTRDHASLFEAADLPGDVEAALRRLGRETGLRFAAHDLVERPDGTFVFLETNPAGQWGWLELTLGLPIGLAVADLLRRPV